MNISYSEGNHKKPGLINTVHGSLDVMNGNFEKEYNLKQINDIISKHLSLFKINTALHSKEATINQAIAKTEADMRLVELSLLYRFIFWMSDWWNYSFLVQNKNYTQSDFEILKKNSKTLLREYLLPILPREIHEQVESAAVINTVCNPYHFALLFNDAQAIRSCILTDTRLIILNNVDGKDAFIADIAPTGKLNTANFQDVRGVHVYLNDN